MKTRLYFVSALAVAAIAFVACNKVEQTVETPEKVGIPFEFIASGIDTKTTNDGLHTNWKSGDQVNLFHAVAGSTTYIAETTAFEAGSDGASVTFTGTLNGELTEDNYDWYAIYPYNKYITTPASTSGGYVIIGSTYNGSQVQTGNDSKAHLAGSKYPIAGKVTDVAKATKPSIAMSHLTSVVAVHVTNDTGAPIAVSEISFTGTENIVGHFFVDFTSSPVVYTDRDGYVSSTATLNVTSGAAIADKASATFYMAIKPFTALNGSTLTLSVTADNGAQVRNKVLTSDANFVAGTINTLNFTYDKAAPTLTEPSAKTGWYRVENPAWLTADDRVVIVNADGTKAMSKVQKSSNRDGVDIAVGADGDYKHITTFNDNAQVFILETGTVSGSFAFWCENGDEGSKYIYAASSSSNQLKSSFTLNDNASFVATLPDGVGNLTAQGSNSRKVMQYNSENTLFNCYESASATNISIYKYYGSWAGSTTCADPVISQEGTTVTITCATPGVKIYYTTDDSTPTTGSTLYSAPFTIASPVTVKAIAVRPHYSDSGVTSQACTPKVATPVINGLGTSFEITCATEGVTIYYETSNVDMASVATPTASSTPYTAAVAITETTYVKAIAVKASYTDSDVASETCAYSAGGGGSSTTILTFENFTNTSYNASENTFVEDGFTFGYVNAMRNASNGTPTGWARYQVIQTKSGGTIYNTTSMGSITNIRVYTVANTNSFTITSGSSKEPTTNSVTRPNTPTGSESITYSKYENKTTTAGQTTTANYYDFTITNQPYFKIAPGGSLYIYKIVITYSN